MKIPASDAIQIIQGNGAPLLHKKILPNDPCRCGSGKKAKHCHGTQTSFLYSKLTDALLAEVKARQAAEKKAAETVVK